MWVIFFNTLVSPWAIHIFRLKFRSRNFSLKTPSGLAALSMSSTSGGDLTNTKVIFQKKFKQNNPSMGFSG
ncbi:MAG: hypothetical protein DRR19_31010 [Candidatus Parabeggiatoa sp. nov. 1]|nr:MAG: hypothetical protein DRR19_31010 [Gammaproteobacteria bacterium]